MGEPATDGRPGRQGSVERLKARARLFKPAWFAHNLRHYSRLRENAPRYRELGVRKSVLGSIAHRDIAQPSEEVPWLDRPDAKQALAGHPDLAGFAEPIREQLSSWIDTGALVLHRFFDEARIDAVNEEIDRLLEAGDVGFHLGSRRVMNAHQDSDAIAGMVKDPELRRILGFVLGREVDVFQTINFWWGSNQHAHSDSFHMTTEPLGFLIVAWIALEDISPESGPVTYYPGSHRLPYLMSEDLGARSSRLFVDGEKEHLYDDAVAEQISSSGIEPVDFVAKKGDVLVWHANLIHGGRRVRGRKHTRRSLVAHYFAQDVLCYHEITERPAILSEAPSAA